MLAPVGQLMERRGLAPVLGLVAVIAGLLGLGRAQVEGWDPVALAMSVGALSIIVALVAPPIFAGQGPATLTAFAGRIAELWKRVPGLGNAAVPVQRTVTAAVILGLVGTTGWLGARALGSLPETTRAAIPGLSRPAVEGLASVLSGDQLRLNGQVVRLSGVEAPEAEQSCGGQGKEARWKCGEAARKQLRELVGTKPVRCEVGSVADKATTGVCRIGTLDIAAELVTRGHVFASQGLFSSGYGRLEQDARNAKRGVWKGVAERPEEYRNRLWEAAKKNAPQGCPIKGQISRNERVYVVPWQPKYREARVRADKGERWFCSEREAEAAGFRRQGA